MQLANRMSGPKAIALALLAGGSALAATPASAQSLSECLTAADGVMPRSGARTAQIDAITARLLPAVLVGDGADGPSLETRMAAAGVPGISVAVIHDGRVEWTATWGYADTRDCTPVTPDTRFQAASISKTIAAIMALRLVEQGLLALDGNINDSMTSWQLPRPTGITPDHATLAQLLSHTGGVNIHGFPGYAADERLPATLIDILEGRAQEGGPPIRIETAPGVRFQYSGGGYLVAQQAIMDASGRGFADQAEREVLRPLSMNHSSFAQPPTEAMRPMLARAHRSGRVIPGEYHIYPELAAASLWTTPSDLARMLLDMQAAIAGAPGHRLSPAMARNAVTARLGGYGLGFSVTRDGDAQTFGHDGGNEGFESTMVAYARRGNGVIVLTNGAGGYGVASDLVRTIADSYGWNELAPRRFRPVPLSEAELGAHVGHYAAGNLHVSIERTADGLQTRVGALSVEPLVTLSASRFVVPSNGMTIAFAPGADGSSASLSVVEGGPPITLTRGAAPSAAIAAVPFLRGSMNEWSVATPFGRESDAVFAVDVDLAAGTYEFKVATSDWSTIDLGAATADPVLVDAPSPTMLLQHGGNLSVAIDRPGRFRFRVDGRGSGSPRLTVTRQP